jgi:hypothetical protein
VRRLPSSGYTSHTKIKKSVNSLIEKKPFFVVGEGPRRAATMEGEGDACLRNALSRLEDVLSVGSRVEPGHSAPRIAASSAHAGSIAVWTFGGTAFWSCWACLEPCWPWIPRKGSYILAWHRVGSTLDLNRAGPAACKQHFALKA